MDSQNVKEELHKLGRKYARDINQQRFRPTHTHMLTPGRQTHTDTQSPTGTQTHRELGQGQGQGRKHWMERERIRLCSEWNTTLLLTESYTVCSVLLLQF